MFFMWICNCSKSVCCKDYLFDIELPLHLCQNLVDYIYVSLFLDSLVCSIDWVSILLPVRILFGLLSFTFSLEIKYCETPEFFFVQNCFVYPKFFCLYIQILKSVCWFLPKKWPTGFTLGLFQTRRLRRINIMIRNLQTHKLSISLLLGLLFLSSCFIGFSLQILHYCTYFVRFISNYFMFLIALVQ